MNNTTTPTTELLTVREVADCLRVDDTTVRRWIRSGALPALHLPHAGQRTSYRITRAAIDDLFNTSSQNGVHPGPVGEEEARQLRIANGMEQ